jgi:hypothetical protein
MGTTALTLDVVLVCCSLKAVVTGALDTVNARKLRQTHPLRASSQTIRVGRWRRLNACSAQTAETDRTTDMTRT